MEKKHKQHSENNVIENKRLKVLKDPNIGIYCNIFSARTSYSRKNGGVVTSLLVRGFEEGLFDSAIVVRRIKGCNAEAVIVKNIKDVESAKGTQYLRVNVTQKLRQLLREGNKRVAIVCTPCEAKAARKIEKTISNGCQITIIGLFCFRAFNPIKLRKEVSDRLNIDIDRAEETQVSQGKFEVFLDGKEYSCRVKDLELASENICNVCGDFTSEFADVSVGSVGSKKGYSTVIVRSLTGEKLVEKLEGEREYVDKTQLERIAKLKKERLKNIRPN